MPDQAKFKRTSIMLFGDSLPFAQLGAGKSDQLSPHILRALKIHPGLGIYNLSIRGNTFPKLSKQISAEFGPRVRDGEIAVIWCGINDSARLPGKTRPLVTTEEDFRAAVLRCLDFFPETVPVFVLGLHHVNERRSRITPWGWEYTNESIDRCNRDLETLSTRPGHNTVFVRTQNVIRPPHLMPDGIHLLPFAYREVAAALVHAMRESVKRMCRI